MKGVLLGLMILVISLAPVYGQVVPTPPPDETVASNSDGLNAANGNETSRLGGVPAAADSFSMMRTIGGMGIVVCLMIAIYFAARKFAPRCFVKNSSEKNLKILETLSMGDRRSIALIEVANKRFLVGTTPHQVNFLTTLPEPVSLVSEPEPIQAKQREIFEDDSRIHFRNLFEVEKKPSAPQRIHPLPDDLRMKMRQLREALER